MSIQRFKECRTCGKTEPRRWTEASLYQCEGCKAELNREIRNTIAHGLVNQSEEQAEANRRRLEPLIESLTSDRPAYLPQRWNPTHPKNVAAVQEQAAQHRDPRAAQIARAMAQDPRPAVSGTQQDRISDPMHILNPLNPLSPISPLNPLNDWDDSPHRHVIAPSEPSVCEPVTHHTSHSSGYESSSSDYTSSYDSGSDSSSYSSGGCD